MPWHFSILSVRRRLLFETDQMDKFTGDKRLDEIPSWGLHFSASPKG